MSLRSPLGRVLGHGSAKSGVHHWWVQRVSAVALVPLTLWFVFSLVCLPTLGYDDVTRWMSDGWTAVLLLLFVLTTTYHSHLGVQVVVEDYVHGKATKTSALLVSTFAHAVVAAASVFAILRIAFRSLG